MAGAKMKPSFKAPGLRPPGSFSAPVKAKATATEGYDDTKAIPKEPDQETSKKHVPCEASAQDVSNKENVAEDENKERPKAPEKSKPKGFFGPKVADATKVSTNCHEGQKSGTPRKSKTPTKDPTPKKPPVSLTGSQYQEIFDAVFERYPPLSSQELIECEEQKVKEKEREDAEFEDIFSAVFERFPPLSSQELRDCDAQKAKKKAKDDDDFDAILKDEEKLNAEDERRAQDEMIEKTDSEAVCDNRIPSDRDDGDKVKINASKAMDTDKLIREKPTETKVRKDVVDPKVELKQRNKNEKGEKCKNKDKETERRKKEVPPGVFEQSAPLTTGPISNPTSRVKSEDTSKERKVCSKEVSQKCVTPKSGVKPSPAKTPKKSFPEMSSPPHVFYVDGADEEKQHELDEPPKKMKKKRKSTQEVMLDREIEEHGTWVQCGEKCCLKWRNLPDIHDPTLLPELWTCDMHPDERYNSCDKPEEDWDEDEHEEEFVFTKYAEGSIVWAKMAGYPWWPAMIEVDPDYMTFFECREEHNVASHYHVVFFDERVSRGWIKSSSIRPFTGKERVDQFGSTKVKGANFRKFITEAKIRAMHAFNISIKERLVKYSFSARYHGKWGKVKDKKMKVKFGKKSNKNGGPATWFNSQDSQDDHYSNLDNEDDDAAIDSASHRIKTGSKISASVREELKKHKFVDIRKKMKAMRKLMKRKREDKETGEPSKKRKKIDKVESTEKKSEEETEDEIQRVKKQLFQTPTNTPDRQLNKMTGSDAGACIESVDSSNVENKVDPSSSDKSTLPSTSVKDNCKPKLKFDPDVFTMEMSGSQDSAHDRDEKKSTHSEDEHGEVNEKSQVKDPDSKLVKAEEKNGAARVSERDSTNLSKSAVSNSAKEKNSKESKMKSVKPENPKKKGSTPLKKEQVENLEAQIHRLHSSQGSQPNVDENEELDLEIVLEETEADDSETEKQENNSQHTDTQPLFDNEDDVADIMSEVGNEMKVLDNVDEIVKAPSSSQSQPFDKDDDMVLDLQVAPDANKTENAPDVDWDDAQSDSFEE